MTAMTPDKREDIRVGDRDAAEAALKALGIPLPVLAWIASHREEAKGLAEGKARALFREPSKAQREAAFGPIMEGGRGGPITSDYIRQQAALATYQAIWDAANE